MISIASIIITFIITLSLQIFISLYFKSEELSAKTMFQLFLTGICLAIAVLLLQKIVNPLILNNKSTIKTILYSSFITSSLLEESGKLTTLLIFLFITASKKRSLKTILLCMFCITWGFCFFENSRYAIEYELSSLLRFKSATAIHIVSSLFAALFVYKRENIVTQKKDIFLLYALLVAVASHGFYNLLLQLPNCRHPILTFTLAQIEVTMLCIMFFFAYKKERGAIK